MKITRIETFLANAGLRNYLFIRLHTDCGLTGIGEATLEWQEKTVETLIHEFLAERYMIGANPADIEDLVSRMVRDQYQGGATVMTAISGIEIALWDLLGKDCGKPIYQLLGGRCRETIQAYANGWYGGARTPEEYAERARLVVRMGYGALKLDPFGVAWKELPRREFQKSIELVEKVRIAVGEEVEIMIEGHGRFDVETSLEIAHALEPYRPAWFEEPVSSENVEMLEMVKSQTRLRIAAGERLYSIPDFFRLISRRAADVVQMDVAHCGGILASKKIAAIAAAQDLTISPHCSIGPVALAAALHLDMCSPNLRFQEAFGEFEADWRDALVQGWNPIHNGLFHIADAPGLGLELNDREIALHPYVRNSFPTLWDGGWYEKFTAERQDR
ncbi:MAG TPA: mandelate racemase/muconate lactonizing enzyme family protein [Terriglobia bacterium]|nr:mandelate racemase/muconate lactonizing enzyme family protein [Terriglobia bacterium]